MKKAKRPERGFSLIETVIVLAIILIIAAYAMLQTTGSMSNYKANAAMYTVSSQMRVARQLAISQRRYLQITFNTGVNPPTITYAFATGANFGTAANSGYEGPPVTMPLPAQTSFVVESGVPDTPMGFGTCSGGPICIGGTSGGPASMYFTPTGQFVDQSLSTTQNGTLFIGVPNQPATARAVTIMGGTGRVRPYIFIGPLTGPPQKVWIE